MTVKNHVPYRMCIACRKSFAQQELVRLVWTQECSIEVDLRQCLPGRGAYLCRNVTCWQKALKQKNLQRALRIDVLHAEHLAPLMQFAQGLE